jgi:hypothetical protein
VGYLQLGHNPNVNEANTSSSYNQQSTKASKSWLHHYTAPNIPDNTKTIHTRSFQANSVNEAGSNNENLPADDHAHN